MTVYHVITTGPKQWVLNTEDEDRAALIAQMLGEQFPYVSFTYEATGTFFDLPDAYYGFREMTKTVEFERVLKRGLEAIKSGELVDA